MAKCGECTLCCFMFPVDWLNKPINTDCIHCNKGCTIQSTKPSECSDYNCMYAQVEGVSINLRPDKCGVIFDKITTRIIYGVLSPNNEVSDLLKKQIADFNVQGFSVIMASIKERNNGYFISPAHKEKHIRKEFDKYITKKYGSVRN